MKGVVTKPIELFAEMELFRLLDQFFDKALYYLAKGYENFNETQSPERHAGTAGPAVFSGVRR